MAAVAVAGCAAADPPRTEPAIDYVDALHEAWTAEFSNVAQFAAPDATFEMEGFLRERAAGRPAIAQMLRDVWAGYPVAVTADGPPYVSTSGTLVPSWITRLARTYGAVPQAPVYRMGNEGFEEFAWFGSTRAGAYYAGIDPEPPTAMAAEYLAAWGGSDPTDLAALYAAGARVTDGLLGVDLEGRSEIARAAVTLPEDGGLPGAALREIPDGGGSAVYAANHLGEDGFGALRGVVLLLDVPGPDGCPGPVGIVLEVGADGLITHEERLHRADAVDRCPALTGQDAWWDDVTVPDPDTMPTRTGTFSQGGLHIALWGSAPRRERLLSWALARFSDGLLPAPAPRSARFVPPDPDPWTTYGFVPGTADIPLPASAEGCPGTGCDAWPAQSRVQALTALAHLWLADPARATVREDFATRVGQPRVDPAAADARWAPPDPAALRAAHTLAWGLMDQPYPMPAPIAGLTCADLAADYLLLTSAPTDGSACGSLRVR